MTSIASALNRHQGFGPGFDFLRLFLSLSVLWFHSFVLTGSMDALLATPAWFYVYAIMPMFFALSGFLIAGSADRLNLGNFLINRGLRIVPALAVEIVISALIIGVIFTTLPLNEYFAHAQFWQYFTNIIGWVRYQLPGVFGGEPVNLSLWTVPFEIGCYVLISGIIVLKLSRRPLLVYFTVYIGCCAVPKIPLYSRGDYSYGIYLYGYPLQQVIVHTLTGVTFWLSHFALSLVFVSIAAAFSWHVIEKPILRLRKRFSFSARRLEHAA